MKQYLHLALLIKKLGVDHMIISKFMIKKSQ